MTLSSREKATSLVAPIKDFFTKYYEKSIEKIILICAITSTFSVVLITFFIFKEGISVLKDYGFIEFVFGTKWSPTNGYYGILPLIAGSVAITLGALVIGVPTGVACAIYLSEVAHERTAKLLKSAVELLAGIPSVVYGFFGLSILVPTIRTYVLPIFKWINPEVSSSGYSILAGAVILAIMILPTIVSISENAISSVPAEYKEASLALGANDQETITKVLVPAAKSGIISSIILGMGRAIGETMAVILITGNMPKMPGGVLDSVATLTGTIAMEMGYAGIEHQKALFAVGIVLFIIIMLLNLIANFALRRLGGHANG